MADSQHPSFYEFGVYKLDPLRRILWCGENVVPLTSRTFDTLLTLIQNDGETVTKEALMDRVWSGAAVEENNLTQCISALRKVFGESRFECRFIVTVPGQGYRFVAEVKRVESGPGQRGSRNRPPEPVVPEILEPADPLDPEQPYRKRMGLLPGTPSPLFSMLYRLLSWRVAAIVAVCIILLGWAGFRFKGSSNNALNSLPAVEPATRRHSIPAFVTVAVLPFADLTQNLARSNLSQEMTEETITRLSNSGLRVIAHTAVKRYQGSPENIRQIGKELRADYVLEGSVRTSGSSVRVLVRLIRAEDQVAIWGRSYNRPFDDPINVQRQVADEICTEVQAQLRDMASESAPAPQSEHQE